MAIEFFDDVVLKGGITFQQLDTPPSDPSDTLTYFNTVDKVLYQWNGTAWVNLNEVLSSTDVLNLMKLVDGSGSELDADKFDGYDSTDFALQATTYTKTEVDNLVLSAGSIRTVSANTTVNDTDVTVLVDTSEGDVEIALITAVGTTREITIKKISELNVVTVKTVLSQTIDGYSTVTINFNNSAMSIKSNSTNWFIK